MADVKISELNELGSASVAVSNDVLPIVDASVPQTKKISVENLLSPITIDKSAGTITSLGTIAGDVNVTADGARFFVSSADYELVSIGRAGSSGASLDQGYLRMKSAGSNKLALHTAGDSYFNGGSVGIGVEAPSSLLEISKELSASSGINSLLTLSGKEPSGVDMQGGEGVGILFKIADEETNPSIGAQIGAISESADDSFSYTALIFSTSQNDETLDEAVRITSDGKVGIGDTSPTTAKLSISHDDASDANGLFVYNPNTGSGAKINLNLGLERNASAVKHIAARLQAGKEQEWTGTPSTVDGFLAFQTVENESLDERMRISSSGLVTVTASSGNDTGINFVSDRSTNGQLIHTTSYKADNSASEETSYAEIRANIVSNTDGSETGKLTLRTRRTDGMQDAVIVDNNLDSTFNGNVIAPVHFSATHSASLPHATATTMFNLSSTAGAVWIVSGWIGGSDSPNNYHAVAMFTAANSIYRQVDLQTASVLTLSLSGASVQLRQNSGATQTGAVRYIRIA